MAFFERYSKDIIESFAIKTIGLSFDKKYLEYYSPKDKNNFDYVSPKNDKAVEITLVTSDNEMKAYVYEKLKAKGKQNLNTSKIDLAQVNDNGELVMYRGGSIGELKRGIIKALNKKKERVENRLEKKKYSSVDLCVCVSDGGLFDIYSFELAFNDICNYPFTNIFFITSQHFICYNKKTGFKEYPRIISESTD